MPNDGVGFIVSGLILEVNVKTVISGYLSVTSWLGWALMERPGFQRSILRFRLGYPG